MINTIYLSSSAKEIADQLLSQLENLSPIHGLHFKITTDPSLEVKANEVLFHICEEEKEAVPVIQKYFQSGLTCYLSNRLNPAILNQLQSCNFIGIQRHLSPINVDLEDALITLGELKPGVSKAEPFIRECESIFFDFNILRKSEVFNLESSGPSGLFSEDVSQMFRYAGMSEVNRYIVINRYRNNLLELTAQLIWYYAEAAVIRFPDHPYFKNSVNEYVVNMKSIDKSISFFKSKVSGRWWVKVPGIEQNRWRACSYEDYREACNDDISKELLKLIAV